MNIQRKSAELLIDVQEQVDQEGDFDKNVVRDYIHDALTEAYISGLRTFAHWKDGVEMVGTTGVTLAHAIAKAKLGELWNQKR